MSIILKSGSSGNLADVTAGLALKVDGSAVTQPVTFAGTVTVVGNLTHNNAAPAANNVGVLPAVASSSAPTYTTGDQVLLSTDLSGNLRTTFSGTVTVTGTVAATQSGNWTSRIVGNTGATLDQAPGSAIPTNAVFVGGTDGANLRALSMDSSGQVKVLVQNTPAVTVSGTVGVTQSTSPWVVSLTSTTITGTVAVTQSTSPWTIQGDSASGAANAGNPVKGGSVFNTTQPTVTNGQTVDNQSTARGAQIVATGVDTFNVTVNAALPAGTNVIGHVITDSGSTTVVTGTVAVTQSTSPWVENVTQWASTALGAPQTFGTVPTGVVIGTSSDIYVAGTRARSNQTTTAAGVVDVNIVGSLGATNSVTNGTFMRLTDNTTGVNVIAATNALKTDLSSVAGTATSTAAAGVQKVGIVGNAGATFDGTVAAGTAPTNGLAILGQFNTTIPTPTAAQTVSLQTDSTGALAISVEGRKQTYRVGVVGFTIIAQGGTTSPFVSVTGSATKTIRITRIVFSSTAGTGTVADVQLRKYSALTGGTANSQSANIAKMDSNNATATAVVNQWSAAATTATSAGILSAKRYEIVTAAVSVLPGEVEWRFGDDNGQSCVLRGTGEFVGVAISAVGTTPVGDCWVEWTEE